VDDVVAGEDAGVGELAGFEDLVGATNDFLFGGSGELLGAGGFLRRSYEGVRSCLASTVPGKFPETLGKGSKDYNHRLYAARTGDFIGFSPAKLKCGPLLDGGEE
jgi:hypothetical protein